ncbi:peptidoglycan DD-metalloendopeptidase family protein [Aestuariibaculum sediminum]|uniref:Peptidoglycan DD-metalloendopeptidase family protein n=1 Tax=Aestuariibaculum sediminum TaxID=2770637 RepID=A0A8J6U8D2_9FLAO|nr:peptidoglycan DD-metalloendopeptidase family protein [Aestuariibaculum sediminum]MBD0833068.1 peptidoglycan DD-metalloendopeptidase family protein [Aestuariibaculum sediminum]
MKSDMFLEVLRAISEYPLKVLDVPNTGDNYVAIDLSETNNALNKVDLTCSKNFSEFIKDYLKINHAKVAFGGYLEHRNLYRRSIHFNQKNEETERNIHLGIDLWCDEKTGVVSVLDGKVHSYKNNANFGDYGPTIILEHEVNNFSFYTLYGHLSLDSLSKWHVGTTVKQGEVIGYLGSSEVNGDYPPHLHFQLINDLQGFSGDYVGVCNKKDLEFYKINCPDPNVLLNL